MRLGRFGTLRLTVDPLFLGVLALAVVLGKPAEAALALIALAAHEFAHLALAGATGFRPTALHLMPFGGVATLAEDLHLRPAAEFLVAAAGPAANLALAALAAWLRSLPLTQGPVAAFAVWVNLGLAAANLVPAEPLDGGRVLRAVLAEWWGEKRAARLSRTCTTAVIIALAAAALVLPLVSVKHVAWSVNLLVLALFIQLGRVRAGAALGAASAAAFAATTTGHLFYRRLRQKRQDLQDGIILSGQHLVMSENARLLPALDRLRAGKYSFVAVCGSDLTLRGTVGEAEAVRVLAEKGARATGADLLPRASGPLPKTSGSLPTTSGPLPKNAASPPGSPDLPPTK